MKKDKRTPGRHSLFIAHSSFFILHCLVLLGAVLACQSANAHPVPKQNHDRTIGLHLKFDPKNQKVIVCVNYRLEVDEFTVLTDDLKPFRDDVDPKVRAVDFYSEFT